jgi:deoxycytidine triphosphate deaminase
MPASRAHSIGPRAKSSSRFCGPSTMARRGLCGEPQTFDPNWKFKSRLTSSVK